MTTFRVLDAIRAKIAEALAKAPTDQPELVETLTEALGELDVALYDLVTQGEAIDAATERLLAHVTPGEPKPPVVEPFDLNAEIRTLFTFPAHMAVTV